MKPYTQSTAKSAATVIGLSMVAALGAPLASATAAPALAQAADKPAAGTWTKPETVVKGEIAEVLAPPGYGGFYDEATFVWRKGSTLASRQLHYSNDFIASGVTAAAVSRTALVWHRSQAPRAGVNLSVYRAIGSSGGEAGWTKSWPVPIPDSLDPAGAPELAVADDPNASSSAVVYSRTTAEGVQLSAVAFSTGTSSSTAVTLGETQVLTTTQDTLDELEAVHGESLIAVAYRLTAADGATSVVVRTSPVGGSVNRLAWSPELVACRAPAGAAVGCGEPTFGSDKAKRVHLFLRGPEGLQHRTVNAAAVSEPVVLGAATGPLAVMDDAWFYDSGRGKSYRAELSVAAAHGDQTTVWRIPASGTAVSTTVPTPGVRLLALGQHGSGRMLAWSSGTGIGTWSDDRSTNVVRVASHVSHVTQLGMLGGLAPRVWYVAGAARGQRLATTLLDQRAPVFIGFGYRVKGIKSGRPRVSYAFHVTDEGGLRRTVVQVRSGPVARGLGKWRKLKSLSHKGRFGVSNRSSFRAKPGFRYCLRVRATDVVGRRTSWKTRGSGGKAACRTVPRSSH